MKNEKDALVIPTPCNDRTSGTIYRISLLMKTIKCSLELLKLRQLSVQYSVVDSGLQEGDRVIVEGMMKVKPDMVVTAC
ncbi:MAG: hypothetical protein MZV64_06745 [Ignavibacteriales bacterium]|nr:hypothetical protein [Ignavibacteriales bacterium]